MKKIERWFKSAWRKILNWFASPPVNRLDNENLAVSQRNDVERYERIKAHQKEIDELKKFRKNFDDTVLNYLVNGQYDEASEYIDEIRAQLTAEDEPVPDEHLLVNETVKYYVNKAKSLGARMEVELKAERIGIAGSDLYSLLTDILRNALEAQENVPKDKRYITLRMERQEPYFIITCENSKSGVIIEANGGFKSTKNGLGRGLGILSMKRIVERYGGYVTVKYDSKHFIITAKLKD
jgi:sensor histidine kinase regulating citrate/malate metabolism